MELLKLSKNIETDTRLLHSLLCRFDYETIKGYFDNIYCAGSAKWFDFELGLFCGTIENDGNNQPMLVDLQFTQRHLI